VARPFSPLQRRQNTAFLAALRRTGNARASAREVGVAYATMQTRRRGHPDFASKWDIALVDAHARFHAAGGKGLVSATPGRSSRAEAPLSEDEGSRGAGTESSHAPLDYARDERARGIPRRCETALRTQGGEPLVVRTRSGRLQVRPAHGGKLTQAAEQLFLQALSATCNIRLSAAAAGASPAAFYRRRQRNPAFAREFRLALEMGYERLEAAAVAAGLPASHADDAWRRNDPPPIPPLTADQALHLLTLHEKSVRQSWEQPHRRRRRGESDATYGLRLQTMWLAEKAREAEREAVRRAAEREPAAEAPPPELPPLPALDQVQGWSKASGKPPHHEGRALFGGWRIADMEAALRKRGR